MDTGWDIRVAKQLAGSKASFSEYRSEHFHKVTYILNK
jgi:hypothetical protein